METYVRPHSMGEISKFKSYYVVWKLGVRQLQKAKLERFKSYYVVWKPDEWRVVFQERNGLNRTM